jgi:hypothetical protein
MPEPVRRAKAASKTSEKLPWLGPDVAEVRTYNSDGGLIGTYVKVGQRWGLVTR